MTQRVRVQNYFVSRDGIAAGEDQTLERPFGHADPEQLASWAGATAHWPGRTDPGGTRGFEDYLTRDYAANIGAEIMGRHKFAPRSEPWPTPGWRGWWGEEPPFGTPVIVLTSRPQPDLVVGSTTFRFLDASPAEALDVAKEAADGKDVRIGGGVTTLRSFLDAGLVDEMHVAVAPVEYGDGLRLWDSPEELTDRFEHEQVTAPSGIVHHFFWHG